MTLPANQTNAAPQRTSFLLDLVLYLGVMFGIREVYFEQMGFIANGLMWSLVCLAVASWRMKVRGVSWKDLGLKMPDNLLQSLGVAALVVVVVMISLVAFELIKDSLPFELGADQSNEQASTKFGDLKGNWGLFFGIMPFVLLQSALEEMLDRGFLISWLERLFSSGKLATVLAVLLQAAIFGFRHSYDLSARSVSVAIIGLIMGIAYVLFGRNLWSIIIAHCALNTFSMLDRV